MPPVCLARGCWYVFCHDHPHERQECCVCRLVGIPVAVPVPVLAQAYQLYAAGILLRELMAATQHVAVAASLPTVATNTYVPAPGLSKVLCHHPLPSAPSKVLCHHHLPSSSAEAAAFQQMRGDRWAGLAESEVAGRMLKLTIRKKFVGSGWFNGTVMSFDDVSKKISTAYEDDDVDQPPLS